MIARSEICVWHIGQNASGDGGKGVLALVASKLMQSSRTGAVQLAHRLIVEGNQYVDACPHSTAACAQVSC